MKKVLILILICSTCCFSCKDSCPKSHTLGLYKTPDHVVDLIKYDGVNTLTFISENSDTINFMKVDEENIEVVTSLHKTVPCDEDDTNFVDLFFEREINKHTYTSNSGDTIKFLYYPIIWSPIADYSEVDILDPTYYENIEIIISETQSRIKEGRAAWEDTESVDFFAKSLNGAYEFQNISYDNVFYWEDNNRRVIFYDNQNGLVGFSDSNAVRWIRSK